MINKELVNIISWLKLNKLSVNVSRSNLKFFNKPKKNIFIATIEVENTKIKYATPIMWC